jgi:cullin 3
MGGGPTPHWRYRAPRLAKPRAAPRHRRAPPAPARPFPRPRQAFESVVNAQEEGRPQSAGANVVPEFLALYVDERMKHDFRAASEAEVDDKLSKVVQLFRFLAAKDAFEEFYKHATAKRLLSGRVASEDLEKVMIGKLRAECGAGFTNKLEGMFADLAKSAAEMAVFRRECGGRLAAAGAGCDLDVTVLTAPNWSSTIKPAPMATLPPHIAAAAAEFSRFYLDKHSGRKLAWNCSKGTAEVRARIGGGGGGAAADAGSGAGASAAPRVYDLTVSTHQMILLLAFNGAPAVSFREMLRLNIPDDELRRNLLSLCNPKIRLLTKSSPKKDVADDDVFAVNDAFSSKLLRFKVPLISMKSALAAGGGAGGAPRAGGGAGAGAGGDDAADVMASVEEGRKALLESVIVRIMKTRKHMEHNALVAEVVRMVSARFSPDVAAIKRRIEHLIERDYIERAPENPTLYTVRAARSAARRAAPRAAASTARRRRRRRRPPCLPAPNRPLSQYLA